MFSPCTWSGHAPHIGVEVAGENLCSGAKGERGVEDADWALADDEDRLIRLEIDGFQALEDGVDRLDEGSLVEGDAVGDADDAAVADDPVHDADVLGEAAAGGFKACGNAGGLVDGALRVGLLAAVVTVAAIGKDGPSNAVPFFQRAPHSVAGYPFAQ